MNKVEKIPAGYKQTEIGVIPEDWELKKLGDCLISPPRYGIGAASVDYSDRLPKYIRITDISETNRFLPKKTVSVDNLFSANYFLFEGDLVVARTGASVGKSYLYRSKDGPLVFAGFLICLSSKKNILLPQYLSNYFKTTFYWNWVKLTSMRSGQPGINGNEFARLLIPLPKILEQTTIATVLSDTDALIEKLEKLIAKKKAIKQGTMQQLLTGKKRLTGFSGEWVVLPLGKLCNYQNGTALEQYFNNRSGLLVISIGNYSEAGKFVETNCYIDWKYFKELKKFVLNKNDLTMILNDKTAVGTIIGRVLYIEENEKYIFNQRTMRLTTKDEIEPLFLYFQINSSKTHKYIVNLSKPGTQIYLNTNDIAEIPIAFPKSKTEQFAIATILSDMDAEIEKLEKKRDKYTMLKQGMMQQLLTGRIRIYANN